MSTPGFTAPASLRPTAHRYRKSSSCVLPSGTFVPQLDAVLKTEPPDEESGTSTTTVEVSTESGESGFLSWFFGSDSGGMGLTGGEGILPGSESGLEIESYWSAMYGYSPRARCEENCRRTYESCKRNKLWGEETDCELFNERCRALCSQKLW